MNLDAFTQAIAPLVLRADEATIAHWARTTSPHAHRPMGVVQAASTEEVQRVVRAANDSGVCLYPISRGKNWGYGDATPSRPGCVILDLSGMSAIREINAELGYAIVEPGVTQAQLVAAVAAVAPEYRVDCTGAGPDASIVGNALERGFGHTPYGDHMRTSCGMECILADGCLLRTGHGHFDNAQCAPVYPYGVGPYLDGLFTQSNLAVVTAMTVWLWPVPEAFRFFYIRVPREDSLGPLLEALRPLRMQGVLDSAVHIGNDLRVISGQRAHPGGERPLSAARREALRKESGLGAWSVSGAITGSAPQVRAAVRRLKRAVRGIGHVTALSDRDVRMARKVTNALQRVGLGARLAKLLDDLEPHIGLLQGHPTALPLRGSTWGVDRDSDTPVDPLEVNAGLLWIAPVMPLRGRDAEAVKAIAEPLLSQFGFDFLVTFTLLNERSMVAVMNISFDRAKPDDCDRAGAAYTEMVAALLHAGYPPYRASLGGMRLLWGEGDTFWETTARIKAALDPRGTLAPGRYIPEADPR